MLREDPTPTLCLLSCSIEISLDSSVWSKTTDFPCRQSELEPGVPACDYFLHGWQTAPGNAHTVLVDTASVQYPLCCPEGVVQFCSSQISGSCNPHLSDTPWRLVYTSGVTDSSASSGTFNLELVPVTEEVGTPSCSTTDVAQIRLYINPNLTSSLAGVILAGNDASYNITSDPAPYIAITAGLPFGTAAEVVLQFASSVSAAEVCSLQLGSYSVCNYILMGQSVLHLSRRRHHRPLLIMPFLDRDLCQSVDSSFHNRCDQNRRLFICRSTKPFKRQVVAFSSRSKLTII